MNKYIKLFSILALAILLTGCVDKQENTAAEVDEIAKNTVENIEEKVVPKVEKNIEEVVAGEAIKDMATGTTESDVIFIDVNELGTPVKEFTMTSFTEIIDGKYFPQYSIKEIKVKKGDLVKLKITNTKGTHDIKIDEFNVFAETPLNEEVVVEFTADKVGSFEYYCTKPGHRENGHWGTLIIE